MEQHWAMQPVGSEALYGAAISPHWMNTSSSITNQPKPVVTCASHSIPPNNFHHHPLTYHGTNLPPKVNRNLSGPIRIPAASKACSAVEPNRRAAAAALLGKTTAAPTLPMKDKTYSVLQQKSNVIYTKPQQQQNLNTNCHVSTSHPVSSSSPHNSAACHTTSSIQAAASNSQQLQTNNRTTVQNEQRRRQNQTSNSSSNDLPVHIPRPSGDVDSESEGSTTLPSSGCSSGYVTPNVLCDSGRQSSFEETVIPTTVEVATPPENTLIILDYDDTLLPTNWVAVQNKLGLNDNLPLQIQVRLSELSELAIQTIDFCRNHGKVVVVTNASIEWVNRSGEKFIPTVWRHLIKEGIEIVSARDRFQSSGMAQKQWKMKIFEETINNVFSDRLRDGIECCVISIGDGDGEREACLEMCRQLGLHDWLFKSLKLIGQPTCNQLTSEHVLIQQAFPEILKVAQSLDMAILDYKSCGQEANGQSATNPEGEPLQDALQQNQHPGESTAQPVEGEESQFGNRGSNSQCALAPTDAFVDVISEQLKHMGDPPKKNSSTNTSFEKKAIASPAVEKTKLLKR